MTQYRLYQRAKSAMQSGKAKTKGWVLEPLPSDRPAPNPLTGWAASHDTLVQAPLHFDSRAEAEEYAATHQLDFVVQEPHAPSVKPKSYAENFSPNRKRDW